MRKSEIFMIKVPYYPMPAVLGRCEPAFCRTWRTIANLPNELCCFSNEVAEPYGRHRFDSPQSPWLILLQLFNFLAITKSSCFNNALLPYSLPWMRGHWRDYHDEWLVGGFFFFLDNPRIVQVVTLSTRLPSAVSSPECHVNSITFSVGIRKMFIRGGGCDSVSPLPA